MSMSARTSRSRTSPRRPHSRRRNRQRAGCSGCVPGWRARRARSAAACCRCSPRDRLDDDAWDEIEEALLTADVGVGATTELVERLRTRTRVEGTRSPDELRALLAEELLTALQPDLDRTLHATPTGDRPAVVMVVGVNGTGKTTTCGKLARVLVADGRTVLLGAADTFRAAAADQLATWGSRVGADTVRGPEGGDPASVAFDAVKQGTESKVDTVLIDTAGRLHTKVGLMDELGKVKRVVERQGPVDETLLVLDATTGQNGLTQARVFTEVVDVSGIVLTKLDGTARGGIVISVQRELGVPVKLVGLGEGADDLAPVRAEGVRRRAAGRLATDDDFSPPARGFAALTRERAGKGRVQRATDGDSSPPARGFAALTRERAGKSRVQPSSAGGDQQAGRGQVERGGTELADERLPDRRLAGLERQPPLLELGTQWRAEQKGVRDVPRGRRGRQREPLHADVARSRLPSARRRSPARRGGRARPQAGAAAGRPA